MENNHNFHFDEQQQKAEIGLKIREIVSTFSLNEENFLDFLKFKSKFYTYSNNNSILIYSQNPKATFVGSYNKFKNIGTEIASELRNNNYYGVKKGEKGMKIYVPVESTVIRKKGTNDNYVYLSKASEELKTLYKKGFCDVNKKINFKIGSVFDISQTLIPVEFYPRIYNKGHDNELHHQFITKLVDFASDNGIKVSDKDFKSISLNGVAYIEKQEIYLNEKLKDTQKLDTLAHEIGHIVLKHSDENEYNKFKYEVEADTFSILITNYFNLEPSDVRKKHLADNFKRFIEIEKTANKSNEFPLDAFDKSMNKVTSAFKSIMTKLDKTLELPSVNKNKSVFDDLNKIQKNIKNDPDFNVKKNVCKKQPQRH